MVNPNRVLLILFYIGVMSGLMLLLSPQELRFSKDFVILIPSFQDFFPDSTNTLVTEEVSALDREMDSLETALKMSDTVNFSKANETGLVEVKGKASDTSIEFPENNPEALDQFFEGLRILPTQEQVLRILHYGDSQLDGDRISEYLRERFQHQFGGCGIGLAPITEVKNMRSTLDQSFSDNWKKQAVYSLADGKATQNNYSLLGSYYWFTRKGGEKKEKAWITYSKVPNTYIRNNQFERLSLLFKNPENPVIVEYILNKDIKGADTIASSSDVQFYRLPIAGEIEKLQLTIHAKGEAYFYGTAMDCRSGVAFDNIAFRGSSGTDFVHISRQHLRQQLDLMNVKLIILQFGVNVIPNIIEDYKYYELGLHRQLNFLKSLAPEADILLIGVSDMAYRSGGKLKSYPNIQLVREAQKNAAFKARCAYWDLFTAMGGENAIINWSNRQPPLAQKDYTHFTRRGAKLVGEMLYNELMKEYNNYLTKKGVKNP